MICLPQSRIIHPCLCCSDSQVGNNIAETALIIDDKPTYKSRLCNQGWRALQVVKRTLTNTLTEYQNDILSRSLFLKSKQAESESNTALNKNLLTFKRSLP